MKRFEELAKATNEYRNFLTAVNEKAAEKIITSIYITAYSKNALKPSIFVDGAFREIIKNSDQVKKEDFKDGYIGYSVTVEGIEFWFLEEEKMNEKQAINDAK